VLDVRDVAVLHQIVIRLRSVGGVGPHGRASIAAGENVAKLRPVLGRCAGDVPPWDEAVSAINRGVVLIAEGGNGDVALLRLSASATLAVENFTVRFFVVLAVLMGPALGRRTTTRQKFCHLRVAVCKPKAKPPSAATMPLEKERDMRFLGIIGQIMRIIGKFGVDCLKVPFHLLDYSLSAIFGSRGAQLNPAYLQRGAANAESVASAALEAVQARSLATSAVQAESRREFRSTSVGETVYAYAAAMPEKRAEIPLAGVPAHVRSWLLGLPKSDLRRLAVAGPSACAKASEGKKCGVVGIALPPTPAAMTAAKPGASGRRAVEIARGSPSSDMLERVRERLSSKSMKPV